MSENLGLLSSALSMAELGARIRARRRAQGLALEQLGELTTDDDLALLLDEIRAAATALTP